MIRLLILMSISFLVSGCALTHEVMSAAKEIDYDQEGELHDSERAFLDRSGNLYLCLQDKEGKKISQGKAASGWRVISEEWLAHPRDREISPSQPVSGSCDKNPARVQRELPIVKMGDALPPDGKVSQAVADALQNPSTASWDFSKILSNTTEKSAIYQIASQRFGTMLFYTTGGEEEGYSTVQLGL